MRREERMGNGGSSRTDEGWLRIEEPIKLLDPDLQRFATLHFLPITRNLGDWPERSMVWDNGVRCLIQVYLNDADGLGINFWICASQDRGRDRYWKQEFLCKGASVDNIAPRLSEFLRIAKSKLDHWSSPPDQLEFGTRIAKF